VDSVELARQYAPHGRKIRLTRLTRASSKLSTARLRLKSRNTKGIYARSTWTSSRSSFVNVGKIKQIMCTFAEDLLEAAKEALDWRVRVTGTRTVQARRRQSGKLHVTRLVAMGQGDEQGNSVP